MSKKYCWVDVKLDDMLEILSTGGEITFLFNGKEYLIEGESFDNDGLGRVGSYYIADANVQENGRILGGKPYPECNKYKNFEELINAPFLEGKTIVERFDKLRFFD